MFSARKSAAPATTGGYQISNSLRFRSGANGNLYRTFSAPTSAYKWTYSGWLKRGIIGSSGRMTFFSNNSYPTYALFSFVASTDQLSLLFQMSDSQTVYVTTSAVFRDPSAWYHIVVSFDSTQSNQANRLFIYVNGVATTFSVVSPYLAYPNQNTYTGINSASQHNLSNLIISGYGPYSEWFDGYMADINFIDGQALTPSSFGEYNVITGVWTPKSYAGTYGTNGFHLSFSNGTSTTTLGYDSSGNGNNWTTNNISLTAGSTYDWMLDSPTPYAGTSYGVGNYAVLNPLKVGSSLSLSNANLTVAASGSGIQNQAFSSILQISGKFYFEVTVATNTNANAHFGVATPLASQNTYAGQDANSWGFEPYTAIYYLYINGVQTGPVVYAGMTATGVFGVAVDVDAGKMWITDPTGAYITGNPVTGVSPLISSITNTYGLMASIGHYSVGSQTTNQSANFGQRPFAYTPPSGYKSLCTYNLPTPTIQNGAAYMAATLYTGNGSTQSIVNTVNGVSFQPDFVWIKRRNLTANHQLYDSIRGVQKALYSDLTSQELTQTGGITAFLSNGITVGSDAGVNGSGDTQVAWNWKAGGTAVTNTAGSITSSVSANPTAGFSVVTYTCQTSGSGTIGHGLGVAPSMIISKGRGTVTSWGTYHVSNGWNGYLVLNGTNAFITDPNGMNNTAPTSNVWTQGSTYAGIGTMVAYCFAAIPGYSAFGSYIGNGSSNGPFVYCGFRPRWVMFKCTSASGTSSNWIIQDTARNTYNAMPNILLPNLSNQELIDPLSPGGYPIDCLSNGFKIRNTNDNWNTSGGTYIYAAFAENPFQNALAR